MILNYRKLLDTLLNLLELAFSDSSDDRKRLHDIEWEADNDTPSVLGEVEVRADTVIGIARSLLKKQPDNVSLLLLQLDCASIYQSTTLVSWIADEGNKFQSMLAYIFLIENLRQGVLTYLNSLE